MLHGAGNAVVIVLFGLTWLLRTDTPDHTPAATATALILAMLAVVLALVTGWLGGELIDRLGVGVDPDAHLDAPPSFTTSFQLRRSHPSSPNS